MSKTKIGRNDPCPCGSGKKYKNCCIAINSDAGADLFTRYNQTIADVKLKLDVEFKSGIKKIRKDAQQSFLRYSVENRLSADHESIFSDWLWFDMSDNEGDTLALDYLRNHANFMPAPLYECMFALSESYLSVYEPITSGDVWLEVRDIFTGHEDQIILKEALDVDISEKPLLLLGRVVSLPEGRVFSGMVLIIENNDGQAEYIRSHIDYVNELKREAEITNMLKSNADIVYGLFDYAYRKKHISINDIRALKLDAEKRSSLQEILDKSELLTFVHDTEGTRWYQDINPETYKRIGLGEDYAISFVSILEDLDKWNNILGDTCPAVIDWQLVNSRFLRQAPPDELLAVWYDAIRDQETERWLHTPQSELDGKTPVELIQEEAGRDKVLQLLDLFAARLKEDHEGGKLIDYMRARIQA